MEPWTEEFGSCEPLAKQHSSRSERRDYLSGAWKHRLTDSEWTPCFLGNGHFWKQLRISGLILCRPERIGTNGYRHHLREFSGRQRAAGRIQSDQSRICNCP